MEEAEREEEEGDEEEEEEEESPKELEPEEEEIAIAGGLRFFCAIGFGRKKESYCEEEPIRGEIK